jgi:hypothetical protein
VWGRVNLVSFYMGIVGLIWFKWMSEGVNSEPRWICIVRMQRFDESLTEDASVMNYVYPVQLRLLYPYLYFR